EPWKLYFSEREPGVLSLKRPENFGPTVPHQAERNRRKYVPTKCRRRCHRLTMTEGTRRHRACSRAISPHGEPTFRHKTEKRYDWRILLTRFAYPRGHCLYIVHGLTLFFRQGRLPPYLALLRLVPELGERNRGQGDMPPDPDGLRRNYSLLSGRCCAPGRSSGSHRPAAPCRCRRYWRGPNAPRRKARFHPPPPPCHPPPSVAGRDSAS